LLCLGPCERKSLGPGRLLPLGKAGKGLGRQCLDPGPHRMLC